MDPAAVSYALARWAGYLGALLVIGSVVFRLGVLRSWLRAHPDDAPVATLLASRAAPLGLLGGALLLASAALRLWFQLRTFVEPGEPVTAEIMALMVNETPWGRGWIAQLGAAIAATGGFLVAILRPRIGWIAAGIAATVVAASAPMTGHAVTEVAGRTGLLFNGLHVLGGGAWLGTLAVVLAAGLGPLARLGPDQRGLLTARLIHAFSPVALVGAALTVSAGAVLSWRYLGTTMGERLGALTGTAWGWALLAKLGALAVVAALGAWNWRVVRPALGSGPAADRIQRSARAEIIFGLILLAVTAMLVALPMPAESGEESARLSLSCEGSPC